MSQRRPIIVAIDGPAGAGKSTVARLVAERLGFQLVDTGAIYRAVAWLARERGVAWNDDHGLAEVVRGLELRFAIRDGRNHVVVGEQDVTEEIRSPEISSGASQVSARPVVRTGLLELQRRLAGSGGAVLEGRDIGTVVCPNAEVKVFLDASPEERARRRLTELAERGTASTFERVLADTNERDARDRSRDVAPLRPAAGALILDSTQLTIGEVVERIVAATRSA